MQHVPRGYPSLAWMRYTSEMNVHNHGVPMKASADCGENLAITRTQCQRAQRVRRPHNTAVVVNVRGRGNENSSARSKLRRNRATFEHVLMRV